MWRHDMEVRRTIETFELNLLCKWAEMPRVEDDVVEKEYLVRYLRACFAKEEDQWRLDCRNTLLNMRSL